MTSVDVLEAYDLAVDAAAKSNHNDVLVQLQTLIEMKQGSGNEFVRQSLSMLRRMRPIGLSIEEVGE